MQRTDGSTRSSYEGISDKMCTAQRFPETTMLFETKENNLSFESQINSY